MAGGAEVVIKAPSQRAVLVLSPMTPTDFPHSRFQNPWGGGGYQFARPRIAGLKSKRLYIGLPTWQATKPSGEYRGEKRRPLHCRSFIEAELYAYGQFRLH